ncbi:ABC transporter permease [Halomarina oriensis]|uniref:ABC transporter permease n=1 Tax=Halomarina oriensis TaxID=671145 RepID=A0A6B0GNN2_9EURY|nr:ABC transporter permease [Halomarina oriensis]MWG36394.1 ABC transporter permease [Halomarina oriensis]
MNGGAETRTATVEDPQFADSVTTTSGRTGSTAYLAEVWVNFKRWNRKALRNPFIVVGSVVQPVVFLLLFSEVFGGVVGATIGDAAGVGYLTFLVPAIVIQVALIAASSSGIGLVNDIENGMFEKVLVTPMRRSAVFVGKTLSEMIRVAVQGTLIVVLGVLLGATIETGVLGALAMLGVAVLFSVWFTAFSNVLALVTRDQESTIIGANLLTFPLLFVSSAFLPIESLPGWMQVVARLNPITYGVDATRTLMIEGWNWSALAPDLAVLVGLDVVFGAVAVFMLTRASSARV